MSFLSTNNSEFLSARITQKGRSAIARGNFKIDYFQIGDSEFDYNVIFSGLTGKDNHQRVMSPFDGEAGIKYPYKLDSSVSGTTYGVPVSIESTETIRNVMGPAGFVTNFVDAFDCQSGTGTFIKFDPRYIVLAQDIDFSVLTGGTTLPVISGNTFQNTGTIILVLSEFCGTDENLPVISGNSTSLIYKIIGVTDTTLELDRPLPNIAGLISGTGQIVAIKSELEYPISGLTTCLPTPVNTIDQQNAWTMDIVWGDNPPIGFPSDFITSGYTGNTFVSTKELLGYTTSTQTFTNLTGGTIVDFSSTNIGTGFRNSFNELIEVSPEEQRCIAIIHFSELGDLTYDPERFFKYDDYISTNNDEDNSLYTNVSGYSLTDEEYFEVYIPFIYYHRNTTNTYGALFHMDSTDYYIRSTINSKHKLLFRYLIDEGGNKVGKIFPNNKVIVFDDQELVAILDFRTNRRYTLGAPKVGLIHSDTIAEDSIFSGGTGQTLWVTYMLGDNDFLSNYNLHGLPCNYYSKINSTNDPSNVTVKFSGNTFQYMGDSLTGITNGFVAEYFFILGQLTENNENPTPADWRIMDYTIEAGGNHATPINPTGMTNVTFVITKDRLTNEPVYIDNFKLDDFMGNGYTSISTGTTQFGEEQTFPGSVRLVRATDIKPLNFLINLPSTQFTETQNPTYVPTADKRITEMALLDSNKEPLVVAKTPIPIKRIGTQVFSLKLDF